MATIELSRKDDGRTITAYIGDVLVLHLDENPTTGYLWWIESLRTGIDLIGDESSIPEGQPPGAGGARMFTFRMKQCGRFRLRLYQARPWERRARPAAAFELRIDVR